jgi:HD-GYP domain-containing protein (c-di-GMP phosphodiesterase class II)
MRVLAATDPELAEHGLRTARLARSLGLELRMTRAEQDRLEASAQLHDIGKLFVSREILDKPGPPTESEWVELRRHPRIGFELVRRHVPSEVARVVLTHHERYDGTGYPSRLSTSDIPIEARVLQVADAFDAMTSVRPYQPAMSVAYAIDELTRFAGTQFDPVAVSGMVRLLQRHDGRAPAARPATHVAV